MARQCEFVFKDDPPLCKVFKLKKERLRKSVKSFFQEPNFHSEHAYVQCFQYFPENFSMPFKQKSGFFPMPLKISVLSSTKLNIRRRLWNENEKIMKEKRVWWKIHPVTVKHFTSLFTITKQEEASINRYLYLKTNVDDQIFSTSLSLWSLFQ